VNTDKRKKSIKQGKEWGLWERWELCAGYAGEEEGN
jgi:hypothetical protein